MAKQSFLRPGPFVLTTLIVAIVIGAVYLAIRTPAFEVDLARVTRGPMVVTIEDEGETRVRDLFVVAAPINGRLARIELEPGDMVTAGETVVARMEPVAPDFLDNRTETRVNAQIQALDAMIASSAMRIEQARAERDLAAKDQSRVAELFNRGFATRASLDRANAALSRSNAMLTEMLRSADAAKFDRNAARANLITPQSQPLPKRALEITSPANGTVLRLPRESEGAIAAGTPLVEIGNPRNLEIVTDLLSADAVRLSKNARVLIDNWGGPQPLNGRIRRVEPFGFTKISALGVEEQRVNVVIDLIDPPQTWVRLGHGFRVIVRAVVWEKNDVLRLPVSALFRDGGTWAVFVVENGRAQMVHVKIGKMNDEQAELQKGPKQGAAVILHPSEKITNGTRVKTR